VEKIANDGKKHTPKTLSEANQIISLLQKNLQKQQERIQVIEQQYGNLQQQITSLLRGKYGKSSEKLPEGCIQLNLLDENKLIEEHNIEEPSKETVTETITYSRKKRNGHRNIPDNLPRVRIEYKLEDSHCPCGCGNQLQKIGEVVTEQLEIVPAKIYIKQHVRFKYAGCVHQNKVITANMPNQPIDKGLAGPGLLADVLVKKYDDHLPLYRQSEILARHGIDISKQTLCDWVMQCADILKPLVEEMKPDLLSSPKLHTDDTVIPVLEEGRGSTKAGRLWGYLGQGPPCVIYEYSPNRQQNRCGANFRAIMEHPCVHNAKITATGLNCRNRPALGSTQWLYAAIPARKSGSTPATIAGFSPSRPLSMARRWSEEFLKNYKGYLQADAYPGYDKIYAAGNIIEVACMAHARRKFFDIVEANKKISKSKDGIAITALSYIGKLYRIERKIKRLDPPAKKAIRKREAKPILRDYKKWLLKQNNRVLPKSPLGKAVKYTLKNWIALTRYLGDGILDIDNNAAERLMRPITIGRANWTFAGNDRGGTAAAIIYSLIETCKLNKINPYEYLRDILTRLPNTLNRDIRSLLPYIVPGAKLIQSVRNEFIVFIWICGILCCKYCCPF
jgi:transposase